MAHVCKNYWYVTGNNSLADVSHVLILNNFSKKNQCNNNIDK